METNAESWKFSPRWFAAGFAAGAVFAIAAIRIVPSFGGPAAHGIPPDSMTVESPFTYSFLDAGTLYEAGSMDESPSPYWWLDSGGIFLIGNGIGQTAQGDLTANDPWRIKYANDNPVDTDQGLHPQNIFRLITKSAWQNMREELYFRINRDQLSRSPNRNESNGILLFARYKDENDLYYLGLRVDGTAIIKKKENGTYYTLAQAPVFPGTYDPVRAPNLLPHGTWIGVRAEAVDRPDGSVALALFSDLGHAGEWKEVLSAVDAGSDASPISGTWFAGVRTDFMDIDMRDFRIEEIR